MEPKDVVIQCVDAFNQGDADGTIRVLSFNKGAVKHEQNIHRRKIPSIQR